MLLGQNHQGRQAGQSIKLLGIEGQPHKYPPQKEGPEEAGFETPDEKPGGAEEEPQGGDIPQHRAAPVKDIGPQKGQGYGQERRDRAPEAPGPQKQGQKGENQVGPGHQPSREQTYPKHLIRQGHGQDHRGPGADPKVEVDQLIGTLHRKGVAAVLHQIGGRLGEDSFIPPDGGIIPQVIKTADQNQGAQQQAKPQGQTRGLGRLVRELHRLSKPHYQ